MLNLAQQDAREAERIEARREARIEQQRVVVDPLGRVDRKNAAKALGREPKTLANWALKGIGPKAFKVSGRVFYRWDEIQAFGLAA